MTTGCWLTTPPGAATGPQCSATRRRPLPGQHGWARIARRRNNSSWRCATTISLTGGEPPCSSSCPMSATSPVSSREPSAVGWRRWKFTGGKRTRLPSVGHSAGYRGCHRSSAGTPTASATPQPPLQHWNQPIQAGNWPWPIPTFLNCGTLPMTPQRRCAGGRRRSSWPADSATATLRSMRSITWTQHCASMTSSRAGHG